MASSQTMYNGGLFSSQEHDGVQFGVVIIIFCPPVASGLVFEKRLCFLGGVAVRYNKALSLSSPLLHLVDTIPKEIDVKPEKRTIPSCCRYRPLL